MNLPEVHKSHDQERTSINALLNRFEKKSFIVRDVSYRDYGVDFNIEPKIKSEFKEYASNFICQIQLKSLESSKHIRQRDSSLSYAPSIRNINYLSNYHCGLFIVYVKDVNIFYWEWIPEIEKHYNSQGIDLKKTDKKQKTYRFKKILDEKSFDIIEQKIVSIGTRTKMLKETIIDSDEDTFEVTRRVLPKLKEKYDDINQLYEEENYEDAFTKFKTIADFTEDGEDYSMTSALALLSKNYDMVIMYSDNAISKAYNNGWSYYLKALSYFEIGEITNAEFAVKKALDITPNITLLRLKAKIKLRLGKIEEAIDCLNNILYYDKSNVEINKLLGEIHYIRFQYSKASFYYDQVLDIDSNNIEVLSKLALLCVEMNSTDEARNYFVRLNSIEENFFSISGLVVCDFILKNVELQEKNLKKLYAFSEEMGEFGAFMFIKGNSIISITLQNDEYVINEQKSLKVDDSQPELDYIIIGAEIIVTRDHGIPRVGKNFAKKERYDEILKSIQESTSLAIDILGDGKCIEFDNITKLFVREEKQRVYLYLEIGDVEIEGKTDFGEKNGFNQFVKYYDELKTFIVKLSCLETNEEITYPVNGNVEFVFLE